MRMFCFLFASSPQKCVKKCACPRRHLLFCELYANCSQSPSPPPPRNSTMYPHSMWYECQKGQDESSWYFMPPGIEDKSKRDYGCVHKSKCDEDRDYSFWGCNGDGTYSWCDRPDKDHAWSWGSWSPSEQNWGWQQNGGQWRQEQGWHEGQKHSEDMNTRC